jgi:SagB-type dehydrogenase family enzyme
MSTQTNVSTETNGLRERVQTVKWATSIYGEAGVALDDPAELYHEASKFYPSFVGRQTRGARRLEASKELQYSSLRAVKRNAHLPAVELPRPSLPATSLAQAVHARQSRRAFDARPLSLAQLATVVHTAYGTTHTSFGEHGHGLPLRTVPSGGALYPLDVYVVALHVEGLAQDLYHYDPLRHALELLHRDAIGDQLRDLSVYPELVEPAGAIVLVAAMFWRSRFKYGLRGYRFALLEAGHLGQNLLLAAAAFDLAAVPIGGFYDARVDKLLQIDGVNESVVYGFSIGYPNDEQS